jgi:hypothetical protein
MLLVTWDPAQVAPRRAVDTAAAPQETIKSLSTAQGHPRLPSSFPCLPLARGQGPAGTWAVTAAAEAACMVGPGAGGEGTDRPPPPCPG